MKKLLITVALLASAGVACAAEGKPAWKWLSASEYYFILPAPQDLKRSVGGTESVKPWGFGVRAVGSETVSKTGGLQLQSVKTDGDRFYLLEMLLGMEYTTPRTTGRPMRFRAGAFGDIGLSDTTLFVAPVLSAGLLYSTSESAETPTGVTFDIFYRLTDIDLDNAGGGGGTLKSAVGFKLGYVFEGFWTVKEKSKD